VIEKGCLDDRTRPFAAGDELCALRRGIGDQFLHFLCRVEADQRAEHDMAARIAGRQLAGAGCQFGDKLIGDRLVDDDPLRRHADLTLIHEGAENGGIDRTVDIGVVEDDQRRLAAKLEKGRLQIPAASLGDDPADLGRSGEIHAPDGRMRRFVLFRLIVPRYVSHA
jgi:hypothetical protein